MLHPWKLSTEIAALSANAPLSILCIFEPWKLILLIVRPEKALVAILSILLFSIEIDLNEDGKTLEERLGVETLTNLMVTVGLSVPTFIWKARCSKPK